MVKQVLCSDTSDENSLKYENCRCIIGDDHGFLSNLLSGAVTSQAKHPIDQARGRCAKKVHHPTQRR